MKHQPYKPRTVSVRTRYESLEDEAPTVPLFRPGPGPMATPGACRHEPLVIMLRPSWVDMPIHWLAWAFARVVIAAIPAIFGAEMLWRFIHV